VRLGPELGQRASALALWEQRGEGEAERCGPKVRWAAARPAGQKKQARGEETGAGRLVGLQPEKEREEKNPFLLFQNYFKSNLNHFEF